MFNFKAPKTHEEKIFFVDYIIELLTNEKAQKMAQIELKMMFIKWLLKEGQSLFAKESNLLELSAPIKVLGDIHGQFQDLQLFLKICGGPPPNSTFVFTGDYVDRGKQSIEVVCLLLCYKIKHPNKLYLLRGNHESQEITRFYGFYSECQRRYTVALWRQFIQMFNHLPVAAIIDDRILCMHGGISPELMSNGLDHINTSQKI